MTGDNPTHKNWLKPFVLLQIDLQRIKHDTEIKA